MATKQWSALDYLKPRDVSTLPQRPGRTPSTFYPDLVTAFVESGEAAMDVDVAKIGRRPDTVRSALAKAIKALGAQEQVKVSLLGSGKEVVLLRR